MIKFENVSKKFILKKNSVHALKNVNLTIEDGTIYGIVGFSGAGKSTLVRMINGLEKPDTGQVTVNEKNLSSLNKKELRELRKKIGMVFQQFNLLGSKTVYENTAMPLVLNKQDKQAIEDRVTELLRFVGLEDKGNSYPDQLSGGQKQRVGIARALATSPDILLCDEATSALDPKTTDSILELLKRINQDLGITIVIITHEMHVIEKVCHRVAVMEKGSIIETGTVQDVFGKPQQEVTKGFVDMIVKEEVPEQILKDLQYDPGTEQLWSIRYWGLNRTVAIVHKLNTCLNADVQIAYATANVLQEYTLNILNVVIKSRNDVAGQIENALSEFQASAERK